MSHQGRDRYAHVTSRCGLALCLAAAATGFEPSAFACDSPRLEQPTTAHVSKSSTATFPLGFICLLLYAAALMRPIVGGHMGKRSASPITGVPVRPTR